MLFCKNCIFSTFFTPIIVLYAPKTGSLRTPKNSLKTASPIFKNTDNFVILRRDEKRG